MDNERRALERQLATGPDEATEQALLIARERVGEPVREELLARLNAALTAEIRRRAPFHTGTFADRPNPNGRIYPRLVITAELNRTAERVRDRSMLGQLAHPANGRTRLADASHIVTEVALDPETDELIAAVEPTSRAAGQALAGMLRAGTSISLRSRGTGSLEPGPNGVGNVVQADYRLISFDFVAEVADEDEGHQLRERLVIERLNEVGG